MPGVSIPRPQVQLVVRFGPAARGGVDAHAMGVRQRAHRKVIHAGQRAVTARLHLGATEAALGVRASALSGRIVALEELWGSAATRGLLDRLASARDTSDAAALLERVLAERAASAGRHRPAARLALDAADRLLRGRVQDVAADLGVSERHLRRVFREHVGLSPKAFARLLRFHRALGAARAERRPGWAEIAAGAGYYDQAHLIAEFRAITGVTPRALLGELRAAPLLG